MSFYGDNNKEKEDLRWEIQNFLSKGYGLISLMDVVVDCIRDYEVQRNRESNKVKRGKWIAQDPCRGYSETYKCSACEEIVTLNTFTRGCSYEYCPECGAKMNEGEEE